MSTELAIVRIRLCQEILIEAAGANPRLHMNLSWQKGLESMNHLLRQAEADPEFKNQEFDVERHAA